MAASLSLGKFLIGASLFTLGFNWLFEGSRPDPIWVHYKGRWKDFSFKSFFHDLGEDADIEWRLLGLGLHLVSIRYLARQYHLHHPLNYSDLSVLISVRVRVSRFLSRYITHVILLSTENI